MDVSFGVGKLLDLTGGRKNEFDGGKARGVLPVSILSRYDEEYGHVSRADFNLWNAVQFKAFVDLTRSGLTAASVSQWIDNTERYIKDGVVERVGEQDSLIQMVPPRDPLTWKGADLFICRECYTADFVAKYFLENREGFSVKWWGGTEVEIHAQIALENLKNASDHRETMSIQFYNLSKAIRLVLDRAEQLGLIKAEDSNPVKAQ